MHAGLTGRFDCLLIGGDTVNVKHSAELKDEKVNGSLVEGDEAENVYIHGNPTPSYPL